MDDLKAQIHKAAKDPHLRQKITALAQKQGVSFNEAMRLYISDSK